MINELHVSLITQLKGVKRDWERGSEKDERERQFFLVFLCPRFDFQARVGMIYAWTYWKTYNQNDKVKLVWSFQHPGNNCIQSWIPLCCLLKITGSNYALSISTLSQLVISASTAYMCVYICLWLILHCVLLLSVFDGVVSIFISDCSDTQQNSINYRALCDDYISSLSTYIFFFFVCLYREFILWLKYSQKSCVSMDIMIVLFSDGHLVILRHIYCLRTALPSSLCLWEWLIGLKKMPFYVGGIKNDMETWHLVV